MHYNRFLKPMVLCLLLSSSIIAQDKASKIDALVSQYHKFNKFNGSILVAEKGNVIIKKGYGLANMEWNIPNKTDTKFRIGSITKQFTSMLIMQLVAEGKIDLDDSITTYLTDYRKDNGDRITVHHLLTHRSGIPSYTSLPNFFNEISRDPYSVKDFVNKFCSGDLEFEPGSKFRYNNSGYFLLGAIIEAVSNKTYADILQERIFNPLGMKNTGYDTHSELIQNRATGYSKSLNGSFNNSAYLDMALPYAAGALYSTVEDLLIWDQSLYTEKLLTDKNKELMFKVQYKFPNGGYAYGWGVREYKLEANDKVIYSIQHSGGINGFNTLIVRLIKDQYLIVLFSNVSTGNLNNINQSILNILYDQPYNTAKRSLAETVIKTLNKSGIESALVQFTQLKSNSDYEMNEIEFNTIGYQLLVENKTNDAIKIFKLNVEEYPKSANAYDSLGEAYMKNGQKDLAINNYKKSFELNPKNTNAEEMIKKMMSE